MGLASFSREEESEYEDLHNNDGRRFTGSILRNGIGCQTAERGGLLSLGLQQHARPG